MRSSRGKQAFLLAAAASPIENRFCDKPLTAPRCPGCSCRRRRRKFTPGKRPTRLPARALRQFARLFCLGVPLENFWGFSKPRLKAYHGGWKSNLRLFIREMEFRFNHQDPKAVQRLARACYELSLIRAAIRPSIRHRNAAQCRAASLAGTSTR